MKVKLELNSETKTITLQEDYNLGELVKCLKKLLPKESPFGSWEEFTLKTNTIINNFGWYYYPLRPYYQSSPWWTEPSWNTYQTACRDNTTVNTNYSSVSALSQNPISNNLSGYGGKVFESLKEFNKALDNLPEGTYCYGGDPYEAKELPKNIYFLEVEM